MYAEMHDLKEHGDAFELLFSIDRWEEAYEAWFIDLNVYTWKDVFPISSILMKWFILGFSIITDETGIETMTAYAMKTFSNCA